MTEAQIISGCRAGDRRAQRALYELTAERVYRVLLRMTRNHEEAADLSQDAFVRAFQRFHQFDGQSSVSTWIYRIAVNEGLQFLRRRKRQAALLDRLPAERKLSGPSDSAVEACDIREAVDQLPEPERTLVVLRHFEGMDYAEMAAIMGKPQGTIGSGLNRARRLLRQLISPDEMEKKPRSQSI